MSGKTPQSPPLAPHLGPDAEAARAARLAREAAALRENLRRRKAQARAKESADEAPAGPPQQTLES
jgi:hypothetical protein